MTAEERRQRRLQWAREALDHDFRDPTLLDQALTHSSGKRSKAHSYERLEFLGDRVLNLAMAAHLFTHFGESEGDMNRRISVLVNKESCAAVARELGVSRHVIMEEAARQAGVHKSVNLLGDVCEALIGALYLEGGFEEAQQFVMRAWESQLASGAEPPRNPKNALQEWAQQRQLPIPQYQIVGRDGPPHAPRFTVEVHLPGRTPCAGEGSSKQEAEKAAATQMLEQENAK
ncbi:ribonuclease III [Pacificimonas flava]|uniref:Ribonuclease 3 n=1 Tax=Pacificimonas flava TaxID=1234595 RepID=M2U960_9SPHN|nr:ribonuclease III [Pacificimonas flava]EMD84497.1 Ribonuclease III [Pacificimonas flava]MBB5279631.1 ribonuclease-3 [Pacificimonas flava]